MTSSTAWNVARIVNPYVPNALNMSQEYWDLLSESSVLTDLRSEGGDHEPIHSNNKKSREHQVDKLHFNAG